MGVMKENTNLERELVERIKPLLVKVPGKAG
jgi:hypothetical protein